MKRPSSIVWLIVLLPPLAIMAVWLLSEFRTYARTALNEDLTFRELLLAKGSVYICWGRTRPSYYAGTSVWWSAFAGRPVQDTAASHWPPVRTYRYMRSAKDPEPMRELVISLWPILLVSSLPLVWFCARRARRMCRRAKTLKTTR